MTRGGYMYETTLEVLKKIESHGFKVYAVGGYVRDLYLKKEKHLMLIFVQMQHLKS